MPMALGIDIYRYQTVTDWNAVKRHGVSFAYVKGTDGGGPAIVRGDAQVNGAKSVDIPVGLYHYAQLSPSPEVQADVLTAEVRRLDALGLPPALDLEDPHGPGAAARDFAHRFLTRLRANGFDWVTLYANTSMLNGITADTIGVPNTVIWAAAYGPNDGRRHPLSYRGRVNIHQYTSVGVIPGISGQVDLNESLTPLPSGGDVELTDKIRFWDGFEITVSQALGETWQLANGIADRPARPDQPADPVPWLGRLFAELAAIREELTDVRTDVEVMKARALADMDETILRAEMEARGISGVTPAQLKEVLISVAQRARTNGD
jgi:GH25 family lysozyme M1 (1,4-beta-N-acetylmuramidase)